MEKPTQSQIVFSKIGRSIRPPVIVDLMTRALGNKDLLSLAAGFTDNTVLPRELVAEMAQSVTRGDLPDEPLQYGTNQGRPGLRELTGEMLARYPGEDSSAFPAGRMMIGNGSQQCLYLAAQVLCDPGDIILVENPSYFVCLEMLKGFGIRSVGIPCDSTGKIEPGGFASLLKDLDAKGERQRVKALYIVSYNSNPSSRCLSLEEKNAIAGILIESGFEVPVIEDAAYRELFFEAPHPVPSILSIAAFDPFPKLYLGTFTKPFATGLKVGFCVCSDPGLLGKMLCVKGHQDFGTAHFNQTLIERMLEENRYEGHLAGIRSHYARKAAVLNGALEAGGLKASGWEWEMPKGGLIFWLRGPAGADLRMSGRFCAECIRRGVLYVPGDLCFAEGTPWDCARLATGTLDEARLAEAASRFASVAETL